MMSCLKNLIISGTKLAVVLKKDLTVNQLSCEVKIETNFHEDGMPKECSHCICLSVILIDFF